MNSKAIPMLLLAAALTGCAASPEPDFILARGIADNKTLEYTGTYPAWWDKDITPGQTSVPIGGYFRGRFFIDEVFGEGSINRKLTLKLSMAHDYAKMPRVFLVIDMRNPKDLTALWWDFSDGGFCLDMKSLHDVHLEHESAVAAREYPCKQNH